MDKKQNDKKKSLDQTNLESFLTREEIERSTSKIQG